MSRRTIIIITVVLIVCFIITVVGLSILIRNSREQFPTTTPTPTPTLTPTPENRISEGFDNNDLGWSLGDKSTDYGYTNEFIRDSRLYIVVEAKRPISVVDTISANPYNFTLSVEADQLSGPANAAEGLVFRKVDDNNFYFFAISKNTQKYMFAVKQNGKWTTLINWSPADMINIAASNKLKVDTTGTKIDLIINDIQVDSVNDATLNSGGEAGVGVELYDNDARAQFVFDNFELNPK